LALSLIKQQIGTELWVTVVPSLAGEYSQMGPKVIDLLTMHAYVTLHIAPSSPDKHDRPFITIMLNPVTVMPFKILGNSTTVTEGLSVIIPK
jgi:hypothetical protein